MYTALGRLLGGPCSHGNIRVPDSRAQHAGAQSGGAFSVANDVLPRHTKGDHISSFKALSCKLEEKKKTK